MICDGRFEREAFEKICRDILCEEQKKKQEKQKEKQCPFLVRTIKVPDSMGGGSKQQFQTCIGAKCAAYYDGVCLRLKERC